MYDMRTFFIDGEWTAPLQSADDIAVIDPATERVAGHVAMGSAADVDRAVAAARRAFEDFSRSSREARMALLDRIIAAYKARIPELAAAITAEMGAPVWLAHKAQAVAGLPHFMTARKLLERFAFEDDRGTTRVLREPIGVCGLITPWNWPVNQVACKLAPALATGCTVVLKPSEVAPLSAHVLAQVLADAELPAGVFNLVDGDGPGVGAAIAGHPGIDMVSFTGSTRAGVQVAQAAAPSVKRVAQELGGKSANILLDDADLARAVDYGVQQCFLNSGQSCNAPTRMLVPQSRYEEAVALAGEAASRYPVGPPEGKDTFLGPVVSRAQWERIQTLIRAGVDEGARLVTGGPERPQGLERGFYVRPTVFADVANTMRVAREEIFGPVLCMIPFRDDAHAVAIANDTPYGLSGYVFSASLVRAREVAAALRTGMVHINGAELDYRAPFGGYRQSGNGREWGAEGFAEYLETKSILGYAP